MTRTGIVFFALLLTVVAKAADLPVLDTEFGCTDAAVAARYVKDYNIKVETFGGMELCNSAVDSKKLFNDLTLVEAGTFAENQGNNLIRGFIPTTQYYPWMKSQTRSIRRGNDLPTATAYNSFGHFTMQDGWAKLSTLGRVGTVVHEARHTGGFRHTQCTQGSYVNVSSAACDRDYATGGSHAVELEYYARVTVQGTNFHPVYRSMARLMAMARGNFLFNQPVLTRREGVLAIEKTRLQPVLFDSTVRGGGVVRELPQQVGLLKRTSFGASIFNGTQAFAIEMYQNTQMQPTINDVYSYFKLLERPGQPVKDFEEYDIGPRRFVAAINAQNALAMFAFGRGDWGTWQPLGIQVARTVTTLPSGQKGFWLLSTTGKIYPYDGAAAELSAPLAQTWPVEIVNVALDEQKNALILTRDGRISVKTAQGLQPWAPAASSEWADVINVPLYDAFEVTP